MAELLPPLKTRFESDDGLPLVGGKLFSYVAGTSTPKATYTDESELVPNTNPVILDSNGEADVWIGSGSYKFILTDADDNLIDTWDDISRPATGPTGADGTDGAGLESSSHAFTAGQSATNLTGETFDSSTLIGATIEFLVIRGTAIFASGRFYLQFLNGAWRLKLGGYEGEDHGLTFSITGTTTAQLQLAADAGNDGTLYLQKILFEL